MENQLEALETNEFIQDENLIEALKKKGFDKPCLVEEVTEPDVVPIYFVHENGKPLYQQVTDWFIEKHQLLIFVRPDLEASVDNEWRWYVWSLSDEKEDFMKNRATSELVIYPTTKKALLKGIEYALTLI